MEAGDLRLMISKKIDASEGVIQLIGNRFGFGPNQPDPRFGRISYTQYEAKYATERNLKVWYILLTDQFPFDAAPAEAAELRELQKAYRKGIEQSESLWYPASSMPEMEAKVLHLRSDLAACRTYSYSIKNLGIQISAPISAGKTWLL